MEQKNENKIWKLPEDWHPELTKGARALYGRLMCLTSGGTQPCELTNAQGAKQLGVTDRAIEKQLKDLRERGLVTTFRADGKYKKNIRHVALVAAELPAIIKIIYPNEPNIMPNGVPNIMPNGSGESSANYPNGSPNEILKSSGAKSAVRLECIRADERSPHLVIERNKRLLISMSSRVGVLAPTLFTELCQFSLGHLKQYINGNFTPWGEPHPCSFDFTGLWDMLTYPDEELEKLKSADPKVWTRFNQDKDPYWRQFFVMTALIELSCYSDQIFTCTSKFDKSGAGFYDYYFDHQYGFPFNLINTVYPVDNEGAERGELEGHAVYKTIRQKYVVGRASLLTFAQGFVLREALSIINDRELCEKAYLGWRTAFAQAMRVSIEPYYIKDVYSNSPDYCKGYFSLDIGRRLLNDTQGFAPRFFFPTLLFRRLVNIYTASRLADDGISGENNIRAIAFIKAQRTKESVRKEWDVLCEHLADAFPFMTKEGVFEHV